MNMAYQPSEMMKIDIGVPVPPAASSLPEFMAFQVTVACVIGELGYTHTKHTPAQST